MEYRRPGISMRRGIFIVVADNLFRWHMLSHPGLLNSRVIESRERAESRFFILRYRGERERAKKKEKERGDEGETESTFRQKYRNLISFNAFTRQIYYVCRRVMRICVMYKSP